MEKLDTVIIYPTTDGWRWLRQNPAGDIIEESDTPFDDAVDARLAAREKHGVTMRYKIEKPKKPAKKAGGKQ
jgi:hypothetical protein